MLIYWVIFLIIATGALLNGGQEHRRSSLLLLLLASLPTLLMIGLRWEIGPDWPGYLDIYSYTRLYSLEQSVSHADPGFFALMWILHLAHAPFWVLNFVCGLIFVGGLTAFARRQPNPWLAFLIAFPYLCIVVAMSGDRQSVALGVLFFGLTQFQRGRLFRFVLLILIGALFHGSVLLIVPFCLLSYTTNGLQRVFLLIFAAIIGFYFSRDAFTNYAFRYSSEKIQSTGVAYRLAMNAMPALIFLWFQRRFQMDDHQIRLWRNISLCTLALVPLLIVFPSSTAVDRFLLYLFPLQLVVLSHVPRVLGGERQAAGQFTLGIIAYLALVQFVFLGLGKFAGYYIPYRTIFDA